MIAWLLILMPVFTPLPKADRATVQVATCDVNELWEKTVPAGGDNEVTGVTDHFVEGNQAVKLRQAEVSGLTLHLYARTRYPTGVGVDAGLPLGVFQINWNADDTSDVLVRAWIYKPIATPVGYSDPHPSQQTARILFLVVDPAAPKLARWVAYTEDEIEAVPVGVGTYIYVPLEIDPDASYNQALARTSTTIYRVEVDIGNTHLGDVEFIIDDISLVRWRNPNKPPPGWSRLSDATKGTGPFD